jgi:protein-S-isoprenylcysteine O-methyltransferase Ste14
MSIVSVVIVVYVRLSLGRNIGFVPAQRNIVRSGAYGYVRHPIYTGLFLAWVSLMLRLYSPANLGLFITICALYVIKSIVEGGFFDTIRRTRST